MQYANAYALLIGISAYKNMRTLPKAVVDVTDVFETLQQSGYEESHMQMLRDDNATKLKIDDGLDWLARCAGPESTIIIYFSGHGIRRAGLWAGEYLCPIEADPDNGIDSLIKSEELVRAIHVIHAPRVAIFFDACHAGAIAEVQPVNESIRFGFSEVTFESITQNRGRVIVASCLQDEEAHELSTMRNSLFAHFLLEGLRGAATEQDGAVYINTLFSYIRRGLNRYNLQHPYLRSAAQDFAIAFVGITVLLQKYYNFIVSKRRVIERGKRQFNGRDEIYSDQCRPILDCAGKIYTFTQQLYNQIDNANELSQHIELHNVSILEALRKISKLITDTLKPLLEQMSKTPPSQTVKLPIGIANHLQELLNAMDAFIKLVEEHSIVTKDQPPKRRSDAGETASSPSSSATNESGAVKTSTYQKGDPGDDAQEANTGNSTKKQENSSALPDQRQDYGKVDQVKLLDAMRSAFEIKDLITLCFRLQRVGIRYGDIKGEDLQNTIINLINAAANNNWYPMLVEEVLNMRKHLKKELLVEDSTDPV